MPPPVCGSRTGHSSLSWRWSHTVSVGAVSASQFHKGPSGGQSQAGACRDRGAPGRSGGGLEGFVAGEHVPGGDQDLARDRRLGGVVVAGAAADVEVELVPGVRFALDRRAAEAATLRAWATATLAAEPGARLIVTGDLNDTVQAATTQILLGPPGSEIGTPGFNQPDHGDSQRLWNLAPLMPDGKNYSRINQGRKELIDHILVSAALVTPLEAITVEAITDQALPSISADPNQRRNAPSSDHAPVVATFTTF